LHFVNFVVDQICFGVASLGDARRSRALIR